MAAAYYACYFRVSSAVEGLEVASEAFKHYIIPITLSILLVLFVMQKKGTAGIGKIFGPVMLLLVLSPLARWA